MESYTQVSSQPVGKKSFFKEHGVMLLAFLVPVVFILGVVTVVYLPSQMLSSEYDFVYATCSNNEYYNSYDCGRFVQNYYRIVDGKVQSGIINPELDVNYNKIPDINEEYKAALFFHDVEKNESREISLEEAQKLALIDSVTAPDGVFVRSSYDRGPEFLFLFDSGSDFGYFLTKGDASARLNLINADNGNYYDRYGFKFIGWVKR